MGAGSDMAVDGQVGEEPLAAFVEQGKWMLILADADDTIIPGSLAMKLNARHRATDRSLVGAAIVLMIAAYVGSYLVRSVGGRYEPAVIGLAGVKWYEWAPEGFVIDFRWNHRLMLVYYPLYVLDSRYWHTVDKADARTYPVNEVPPEDIWKVYDVWQR